MTGEEVIFTRLAMKAPPSQRAATPSGVRAALMRVTDMPLGFYRYLAEESAGWTAARSKLDALSGGALKAILDKDTNHLFVLYLNGAPGGWFLLSDEADGDIELSWLFCLQGYEHRGMVRYLLSAAIDTAWSMEPARVTVTVRSDDRPVRLNLYQSAGFEVFERSSEGPPVPTADNDD